MPELSVIIVTTHDPSEIDCIPKFEKSDFNDYEVIVRSDKGIAKARNNGIKEADADKLVFIDDDADPGEGYLQAASCALDQESIIAGKVVHPGEGLISLLASHYPTMDESQYVCNVIGCNMGFRRCVFEEVGFFDEDFKWGHEESELISRAKKEYPIYYEPGMSVTHPYSSSIYDYWQKQSRFGPADIHRAQKEGKTESEMLKTLCNPLWYINSDPRTLPIYFVGRLYRSLSRILAIYRV